ncbi:MAG: HlyD family secretion protein [Rhizobiaceae bacterium]
MRFIVIGVWLAILSFLVSIGVISKWHRWMKISPIIVWAIFGVLVFVPMGWVSPTGPAIVLARSVQIAPSVSGTVVKVNTTDGARVEKGDILFELDRTTYQADVDRISTQLQLAQERLEQKATLLKRAAGTQVDVESAQTEVNVQTANLQAAKWKLERTVVKAPADGFVSNVVLPVGAEVSAGEEVMPFFDENERFIVAQIEQNQLRDIKPGQQAEVVFNVLPGRTLTGKVQIISSANPSGQISPSGLAIATDTPRSDPFWVAIELDDANIDPRPGMTGTVAIYTQPYGLRYHFRRLGLRMQAWLTYFFVF